MTNSSLVDENQRLLKELYRISEEIESLTSQRNELEEENEKLTGFLASSNLFSSDSTIPESHSFLISIIDKLEKIKQCAKQEEEAVSALITEKAELETRSENLKNQLKIEKTEHS